MGPPEALEAALVKLSEAPSSPGGGGEPLVTAEDVEAVRACAVLPENEAPALWQGSSGVSMSAVAKALGDEMRDAASAGALPAAAFYACLLRLPGCPVGGPNWVQHGSTYGPHAHACQRPCTPRQ